MDKCTKDRMCAGMPLSEIRTDELVWVEENIPHLAKTNDVPLFLSGSGSGYGDGDGYGYGYGYGIED